MHLLVMHNTSESNVLVQLDMHSQDWLKDVCNSMCSSMPVLSADVVLTQGEVKPRPDSEPSAALVQGLQAVDSSHDATQ